MNRLGTVLGGVLKTVRRGLEKMSAPRFGDSADRSVAVISIKNTLALHAVANAQRSGGTAAFIDAENALDPGYARKIGVDLDNLLVSQPNSGEEALSICEQLVKSGAVDIVVIDSVAALTPSLAQTNALCIFTNKVCEKSRRGSKTLPMRAA